MANKINSNTFLNEPKLLGASAIVVDAGALMRITAMGGGATLQPVTDQTGATAVGTAIVLADGESQDINWRYYSVTGSGTWICLV